MRPRIVVFAYSEVGSVCLKQLVKQGANIAAVFTHEDDPNEEIWFQSVKQAAQEAGIPVRTPKKLDEAELEYFRSLKPELVLSMYYRAIIPDEVLEVPRLGAYNIHGALLPKYRGRACVNWAVLNGEMKTGSTLHVMTSFADRGDIVDQEEVSIEFEDTAHDVFLKVVEASRRIIERRLPELEAGTAPRREQDESQATKFGRRRPEDGVIDWSKSAAEIYNLVRAVTHPFPGAFTEFEGKKMFVWKARPVEGSAVPKEIVSKSPFLVGTGDGLLEILSFQFEGGEEKETF